MTIQPPAASDDVAFGPDPDWSADRALGQRMPRVWPAFFARFGRLTAVQRAAMGPILDGESVLVCAPTAAGKTEAACAPLVERQVGRRSRWTMLYISPTRALVNDLYERLRTPLEQTGLRVARRTGDHRDDLDRKAHVLLTTPESFDSLLSRGRSDAFGHVLAHVNAVVLDEIHLLHGSARGEQVRWLLERLRRLRRYAVTQDWCREADVQIVALSATVPAPEEVLSAYLPGGRLVQLGGGRDIQLVEAPVPWRDVERALPSYVARLATLKQDEKILVFCNARDRVDMLASELRPNLEQFGYTVLGHHGSLAQRERESAEHTVKSERRVVLFATSTLEIGVDIGDIDLVVLDRPAHNVPAFLQRIGRGNRRSEKTRVMLCASAPDQEIIQAAMLRAARESYLGPAERGPHYAVARQQLASYIFQAPTRSRSIESLQSLLGAALPEVGHDALLEHLFNAQELIKDAAGVRLGDVWLNATGRGDIHSNIEGQPGYTVTDQSTGDAIAFGVRYKDGRRLAIAGNTLQVMGIREHSLEVRRTKGGHVDGTWSYATSPWMKGAGQPQAVRRHLRIAEEEWPAIVVGGHTVLFHFGGAQRKAVLDLLARRAGVEKTVEVNEWTLAIPGAGTSRPAWLTNIGPALLETMVSQHLEPLERALGRPAANKHLPLALRIVEVRQWLDLTRQLEAIQSSRWIPAPPEVAGQLVVLFGGE